MTHRPVSPRLAYVMLVLASLFWAGNIVLGRAVHGDVPPVALTFWRWAVALLVLLPFTIGMARRQWPAIRREWKFLVLLGLTGMAVFHSLQYSALNLTTAVNVTLILAITPVVIPIMSRLIWGERLAMWQGAGRAHRLPRSTTPRWPWGWTGRWRFSTLAGWRT